MVRNVKRLLSIIAGVVLILIGIIGGFIPIMQGWVFILAGALLLGINKTRAWRRMMARIRLYRMRRNAKKEINEKETKEDSDN